MAQQVTVEFRFPVIGNLRTSSEPVDKRSLTRQELAEMVSRTVEGERSTELPYRPNEWTDTGWVVDSGNDWRVFFSEEHPHRMSIAHRYHNFEAEQGLAQWIAYRTGSTVVLLD